MTTADSLTINKLIEGWEQIIHEHQAYPHKDKYGDSAYAATLAAKAMSWSAPFDAYYRTDPLLNRIHYDFGLLESLHGLKAKKLWNMQAKRIKKVKRRYCSR